VENHEISATPTPTLSLLKEIPGVFALEEMRRIGRKFRLSQGRGDQIVPVSSEPGIDKSRLDAELKERRRGDPLA